MWGSLRLAPIIANSALTGRDEDRSVTFIPSYTIGFMNSVST